MLLTAISAFEINVVVCIGCDDVAERICNDVSDIPYEVITLSKPQNVCFSFHFHTSSFFITHFLDNTSFKRCESCFSGCCH